MLFGVTIDYQLRYHMGLESGLVSRGWRVDVVSSVGPNLQRLGGSHGIRTHSLSMARNPAPFRDLVALARWIVLLLSVKPNIVVMGTPKAGLLGLMAATITRVPHRVYEVHGLRLESSSGVQRRVLRLAERISCALATVIVPVSSSLAERMANESIVPRSRIEVMGMGSSNGVDVGRIAASQGDVDLKSRATVEFGIDRHIPTVLFIGRLTEDKGLRMLAEAIRHVAAEMCVQLLIVGSIDDDSGRLGLQLLKKTGAHVIATGELPDVVPALAVSDVLCLPSRREGLPTVILEAFAAGVPVIGTRATGITDLIVHEETGLLVDLEDSVGLASAIVRIVRDDALARKLAGRASSFVLTHFDMSIVQERWFMFLDTLESPVQAQP